MDTSSLWTSQGNLKLFRLCGPGLGILLTPWPCQLLGLALDIKPISFIFVLRLHVCLSTRNA